MSDQPKPTGEWDLRRDGIYITGTHDKVASSLGEAADAHNAALDAEREDFDKLHAKALAWQDEAFQLREQLAAEEKRANDSIEENVRLMNRLAAEREKVQMLVDVLKHIRDNAHPYGIWQKVAESALAKVKERK